MSLARIVGGKIEAFLFEDADHLSVMLSSEGDGTGVTNVKDQGEYYLQPPSGQKYIICGLRVWIKDFGAVDAGSYGNNVTLANGMILQVKSGTNVINDITRGVPIKTNGDWLRIAKHEENSFGSGANHLSYFIDFLESGVRGVVLNGTLNQRLSLNAQDNMPGLVFHYFTPVGYKEDII